MLKNRLFLIYADALAAPIVSFLITSIFVRQLSIADYSTIVFVNAIVGASNFLHSGSVSGIFTRRSAKRKSPDLLIIRAAIVQLLQFFTFSCFIISALYVMERLSVVACIALASFFLRRIEISYFAFRVNQMVLPLFIARTICKTTVFMSLLILLYCFPSIESQSFAVFYLTEPFLILCGFGLYFRRTLFENIILNKKLIFTNLYVAYCKNWRELIINGIVQFFFWFPVFVGEAYGDKMQVAGFGIIFLWININNLLVSTFCDFTYKKSFKSDQFNFLGFYLFCAAFVGCQSFLIFKFGEPIILQFFGIDYQFVNTFLLEFSMFALLFFCFSRLWMRRVYQLSLEHQNIYRVLSASLMMAVFSLLIVVDKDLFYRYYLIAFALSFDFLGYVAIPKLHHVFRVKS